MNIAAFDLSLTSSGWASNTLPILAVPAARVKMGRLSPPKGVAPGKGESTKPARIRRVRWIRDQVESLVRNRSIDLAVVEGYSYGSQSGREFAGELGGAIRCQLSDMLIPWVEIAPTKLMKFATGSGRQKDGKEAVFGAAIRRLGYTGDSHDEADALWLLHMALVHYELTDLQLPQVNLEALKDVEWPKL
jgi:Holliday junction resolvasome RuvABC endonuclease subunit